MQVRDLLKTKGGKIYSIGVASNVEEAIARMVQHNIGSLPVVDDGGGVVGIFTERDVLRGVHHDCQDFSRTPIRDVMTRSPVSCAADDDVNEVMGKMSEFRVGQLPVLEEGRLAGLVSIGDVVKSLYERVKTENHHLMTYIHGPA